MRNPSQLKQEFLMKWITGLKIYASSNKNMTISERKKAIKLSADIALASSRNGATRWSRAVIAGASLDDDAATRMVAHGVLGRTLCEKMKKSSSSSPSSSTGVICSKKILKRSQRVVRKRKVIEGNSSKSNSNSIAKRLVKKRSKVLRGLVPGGEFMDDLSLIKETLDYISALQAQVHVMRCLATATTYVPSS